LTAAGITILRRANMACDNPAGIKILRRANTACDNPI